MGTRTEQRIDGARIDRCRSSRALLPLAYAECQILHPGTVVGRQNFCLWLPGRGRGASDETPEMQADIVAAQI